MGCACEGDGGVEGVIVWLLCHCEVCWDVETGGGEIEVKSMKRETNWQTEECYIYTTISHMLDLRVPTSQVADMQVLSRFLDPFNDANMTICRSLTTLV